MYKSISNRYIILSFLLTGFVYANANEKNYCEPLNLMKYNPTPVSITQDSLNLLTDSLESHMLLGNIANTETKKINTSPVNIFALTNEALLRYLYQYADKNSSNFLMDTKPIIGASIAPQKVIRNRTDVQQTIMTGMLSNITTTMSSDGTLQFPGTETASTLHSKAISDSNQAVYNTYANVGKLSYNDAYKNYLCSVSPATSLYSSSAKDISQLTVDSIGITQALQGCIDTLGTDSGSTSSNSTSTATTSLKTCSAPVASCIMNYVQEDFAPEIVTFLNAYHQAYPERVKSYDDTLDHLNDILNADLSEFATSTGLTCPTDTISATCSGSDCASTTTASTEASIIKGYLDNLNTDLQKLFREKLNTQIDTCLESTASTSSSTSDLDYYYDTGISLIDLVRMKSAGTPNTSSSLKCSDKTTYQTDKVTAIANQLINQLDESSPIPTYIAPQLKTGPNITSIAGSFALISNPNNYSNFSDKFSTIVTERTLASNEVNTTTKSYNKLLKHFITAKALALQTIRDIVAKRLIAASVPTIYNPLDYNSSCSNGINATSTDSDCSFSAPYDNLSIDLNVQAGELCSIAEVESIQANWRLQPLSSDNNANSWQAIIRSASGKLIAEQKSFLLAEINQQLHRNNLLREKLLALKATDQLIAAVNKQGKLNAYIDEIKSDVYNYNIGGTTSSSTSDTLS